MQRSLTPNLQALATKPQEDGAISFVKSWHRLTAVIASKSTTLIGTT